MGVGVGPMPLGRRIVASVVLGLILILLLFGIVALWTIYESTEAAYRERVRLAQALVSRVDDVLRYGMAILEREAAVLRLEPGRSLTEQQLGQLADVRPQMGAFVALAVTDAQGGSIIWTDPPGGEDVIGNPFDHVGVQLAVRTGEAHVAEIPSPIDKVRAFACLAVPLLDPDGHIAGALMARLDLSHPALNLLPSAELGDGLQVQLLSSTGRILAGIDAFNGADSGGTPEHQTLLENLVATRSPGYRIHDPSPEKGRSSHVVAYAPVSLMPSWGIIVEQPRDIVLATPRRLQQRLATFGLAAVFAAAGVAWLDARRVVRPLKRLTAAAERFAAGQLDEPVHLDRSDELGILAHAFETMRQRLRASLTEVAEWNRSALLDPDRVIALVAQKARSLIATEVAGLSLVEEGSGDLIWHLLIGSSDRLRQVRLGSGEGIGGRVMQSGQPLVVADCDQVRAAGPKEAPLAVLTGLRAVMAVPLQSGGRTFGVLMVADRTPTSFSQDQVTLLSSLADHAAVALENARLYKKVQWLAVLEERERIAREMHDGLAQVLGYVNTKTLAVARLLEVGKIDEARDQIAQLEAAAKEVYADVRGGHPRSADNAEPGT